MEYTLEATRRIEMLVERYRQKLLEISMNKAAERGASEVEGDDVDFAHKWILDLT